jgi:hypothetical protein
MGSTFSGIDFTEDFDDAILDLKVDKTKLTNENFSDTIFLAIDDKYPKKKNKENFDKIINELGAFKTNFFNIMEKYPRNNEKTKLKDFILEESMKIDKIIVFLQESKEKAPNRVNNSKQKAGNRVNNSKQKAGKRVNNSKQKAEKRVNNSKH